MYLGGQKWLQFLPLTDLTRYDGIFTALRRAVPKLLARDAMNNAWISVATWRLVNKRVSSRQYPAKDQALIQRLIRAIAESLRYDRQRRAEESVAEVEALLGPDPTLQREYLHRIKGWY